ncbi:MAG TPA: alpha/beta fold hydrolase [Gemmatimonadales bacterium]|nr:alpha/beta fold hydrolase [Gemmatimonadales bacterium]
MRRLVIRAALLLATLSVPATRGESSAAPAPLPRRAFLGVVLAPADSAARAAAHLAPGDPGVLVQRVLPGSTAERAGIAGGDVIVALDTLAVRTPVQLTQAMARRHGGERATLRWRHAGRPLERTLALAPQPREQGDGWDVEYGQVASRAGWLRTLVTRPRTPGRHPALMLIQGIGTFTVETPLMGVDGYGAIVRDFASRGFVTMRVDKPGCGDSEGGPLRDVDFETQLDGFRAALAMLRSDPGVDPGRILVFGHSMGGAWAPLLADELPVRGIAVYGTLVRTWTEYLLENDRRQGALGGQSAAAIDSTLKLEARVCNYLWSEGLSPREMSERHPELAPWVDSSMTNATYYAGCHYRFFQQLAAKNLAAAWARYPGYVLSLYGRSDFLSGEEDHALIARIVNQAHPGHARFQAIDGIDHAFRREATQAGSFATWGQPGAPFDDRVVQALRAWSDEVVKE